MLVPVVRGQSDAPSVSMAVREIGRPVASRTTRRPPPRRPRPRAGKWPPSRGGATDTLPQLFEEFESLVAGELPEVKCRLRHGQSVSRLKAAANPSSVVFG